MSTTPVQTGPSLVTLRRAGWATAAVAIVCYSGFAVALAGAEILTMAGVVHGAKPRALPPAFIVHALTGGIALTTGILQLNPRLRTSRRSLHRSVGRVYVGAVWAASITGLASAVRFDVVIPARVAFAVVAVLWFAATTIAVAAIRRRDVVGHRRWMIRSYALSLFFVTLELWVAALATTALSADIAYPLAVWAAWLVNLTAAEAWIHRTNAHRLRPETPAVRRR